MAAYDDKEDLIAIGAYQPGTDPLTDAAIAARNPIEDFLRQRVDDPLHLPRTPSGGVVELLRVRRARAHPPTRAWRPAPRPGSRARHPRAGHAAAAAIPPLNLSP